MLTRIRWRLANSCIPLSTPVELRWPLVEEGLHAFPLVDRTEKIDE
jgi:hypothetical protein